MTITQPCLVPVLHPDSNKLSLAYELLRDFENVPKGFQYDGASIPKMFWVLIGSPFQPNFMRAALQHDWAYHVHSRIRCDVDRDFYRDLLFCNVKDELAVMMYNAVRVGGAWYWKNDDDDKAYLRRLADKILEDGRNPLNYGLNIEVLCRSTEYE